MGHLDDECRVMALLEQTSRVACRARARQLAPANISAMEAAVLLTLDRAAKPTTPADISRSIDRGSGTASKLVQRLEAKGLVTKSNGLDGSDTVAVAMTDKGREAYDHSLREENIRHPMSLLSAQDVRQLELLLMKLLIASRMGPRVNPAVSYPSS